VTTSAAALTATAGEAWRPDPILDPAPTSARPVDLWTVREALRPDPAPAPVPDCMTQPADETGR
jgi:hypothetical protein